MLLAGAGWLAHCCADCSPAPQVKYILGLKLPRADTMQKSLELIFDNISGFK